MADVGLSWRSRPRASVSGPSRGEPSETVPTVEHLPIGSGTRPAPRSTNSTGGERRQASTADGPLASPRRSPVHASWGNTMCAASASWLREHKPLEGNVHIISFRRIHASDNQNIGRCARMHLASRQRTHTAESLTVSLVVKVCSRVSVFHQDDHSFLIEPGMLAANNIIST